MEMENKVLTAVALTVVIALLFMYREVNGLKLNSKTENDNIMKRIKSYDEFQSNFDDTFERKLKSMMASSEQSDE